MQNSLAAPRTGKSEATLKIGLLGCGSIGQTHSDNMLALGRKFSFVCDPIPARAETLGKPHGAKILPDLSALLNEADAVIIATPDFQHFEEILACAKAGKHIFCEKPICLTVEEGLRIRKALQASRSKFMSGYVLRYFPNYRKAKELLDSGILGRFVSTWSRRYTYLDYSDRPWVGRSSQSGGLSVHFLSHDLDFQMWLAGDPHAVCGWTQRVSKDDRFDIEDNVSSLLTFKDGTAATAAVSWTSPAREWSFGVMGDEGSVIFGKEELILHRFKKEPEVLKTPGDGFIEILRAFVEGLEQGKDLTPGFEESFRALAVARAVQESSKTGKIIDLSNGTPWAQ